MMTEKTRNNISTILKCAIVLSVTLGLFFSFLNYEYDGYSAWHKRLLYFTTLSGIWVALLSLFLLIFRNKAAKHFRFIGFLRFIFTVSITLTGAVFCGFLAPFADEGYHPWSYYSILNHVVTPILAVADYFIDSKRIFLKGKHVFLSLIPPLAYFLFSLTLSLSGVDFGRGYPYPYIFLDISSPVGFFGASLDDRLIGTFWWLLALSIIILGIGLIYARLNNTRLKKLFK